MREDRSGWTRIPWQHERLGYLVLEVSRDTLIVRYRETTANVPVQWKRMSLGGWAPMLTCPSWCGNKTRTLLWVGDGWKCRRCCGFHYLCQTRKREYALKRCRDIRIQLGGSGDLREPFPRKPWRVRWWRYWSLRLEEWELNPYMRHDRSWIPRFVEWVKMHSGNAGIPEAVAPHFHFIAPSELRPQ